MSKPLEISVPRNAIRWTWAAISMVLLGLLFYTVERHQTAPLLTLFFLLFALAFFAFLWARDDREIRFFLGVGIALRLLLFGGMPVLSDDIFRFLWDGYLVEAGVNPFVKIPSEYMMEGQAIPGLTPELFARLNSPDYHSVYPPIGQGIYWLAVKLFPHSWFGATTVIRAILLLGELGTLWLMQTLLQRYRRPSVNILLYALNPLVILEFTGNLHFEGLVIFFLLAALYALKKRHRVVSSILYSLAVITKLLPLMYLPLLLKRLRLANVFIYYFIVGILVLLSFMPFLNRDFLLGLKDSLALYFQTFEFNASLYYIVREVGYWVTGFNIIGVAGKVLAVVSLVSILTFVALESPKQNNLPRSFLWVLCIYLLFTTTVHPWYVLPVLAFSVFTNLRFPTLWTALIFLTYAGYTATGYQENLWLVAIEYIAVGAAVVWEIRHKTKKPPKDKTSYLVVSDTVTLRSS